MELSICIPVYNNKHLFKYCLESIGKAVYGVEDRVEVVISDNASEDNIFSFVKEFKRNYPNISITFNRNEINKGMAYNIHKVVEISKGEFCWIVGSDDFVLKSGVGSILSVIDRESEIDFISVNYSLLFLDRIYDNTNDADPYHSILNLLDDSRFLKKRYIKKNTGRVGKWDELIDPVYDNVMFGAIMAGVFRRNRWISVSIKEMDMSMTFSNVENTYPHCAVYAKCMIGRPAYYLVEPAVIVGEGAREWAGKGFWDGFLPIIYLKILDGIIDVYKKGGLDSDQVAKCRRYTAMLAGRCFFPYIHRRYILNQNIKNKNNIRFLNIMGRFWRYSTFYSGMKTTYNKWRNKSGR